MSGGRVGRPFKITDGYVVFLAVVRYLFSMPYRQVEGFTRALSRLVSRLPPVDYSWVRRRILRLDLSPYKSLSGYDGTVAIAVDSSGVSVHKCNEVNHESVSNVHNSFGRILFVRALNGKAIRRERVSGIHVMNGVFSWYFK